MPFGIRAFDGHGAGFVNVFVQLRGLHGPSNDQRKMHRGETKFQIRTHHRLFAAC